MWPLRRRSHRSPEEDVFWLSCQARVGGLVNDIQAALARGEHVLLVSQTATIQRELSEALDRYGDVLATRTTAQQLTERVRGRREPACIFAQAALLVRPTLPGAGESLSSPIVIMVAERAPLRERDDTILDFAAAVSPQTPVVFHVSTDDLLLRAFGGQQTAAILSRLGMKQGESLKHPYLTKAVRRAQQKIAKECRDPARVDSWLAERIARGRTDPFGRPR